MRAALPPGLGYGLTAQRAVGIEQHRAVVRVDLDRIQHRGPRQHILEHRLGVRVFRQPDTNAQLGLEPGLQLTRDAPQALLLHPFEDRVVQARAETADQYDGKEQRQRNA